MTTEQIQQFKKLLEDKQKDLKEEIEKHQKVKDFGSDVDPDEETHESEEFYNELSMVQTLKQELTQVEAALEKITKGTYGRCEKCQKEIEFELLKINPESRLCRDCKLSERKQT